MRVETDFVSGSRQSIKKVCIFRDWFGVTPG